MSIAEFLKDFDEFLGRIGWQTGVTPWSYVEQWESWVDDFEEGYDWSYDEYRNDVHCRQVLERAFNEDRLNISGPQILEAMRERVELADNRLRELFLPGVEIGGDGWPWWNRGVLSNGVGEYAKDMKQRFDIELPGLRAQS